MLLVKSLDKYKYSNNPLHYSEVIKMLTKSQLEKLYDKEDRLAERAGNAEERLMRAVYDASRKDPAKADKFEKIWVTVQGNVDKLMSSTEVKIRKMKTDKAVRGTEARIASLEKQINMYYEGIAKVDKLLGK